MSDENMNTEVNEQVLTEEDTTKDLYLTFELDDEDYGVDVVNIKEIITMAAITVVPNTDSYIKGIINLRGDIVPVISVRSRFNKVEREYDEMTCIVVVDYGDYIIGLIVDQVKGVLTIPEGQVSLPPSAKLSHTNKFVKNIGNYNDDMILLLDIDKLLF